MPYNFAADSFRTESHTYERETFDYSSSVFRKYVYKMISYRRDTALQGAL